MNKYIPVLICSICIIGGFNDASALVNPQNISRTNAELKSKADKACAKYSNLAKYDDCVVDLEQEYEQEGLIEGTTQYCEKHYANLSTPELNDKLHELLKLRKTAEDWDGEIDNVPGEITKEGYISEILCVNKLLKQRHFKPKFKKGELEGLSFLAD